MDRADALSGLAAALLALWTLAGLPDRFEIGPALQPLPAATEATHEPRRWQQPGPRTLQRFPGP
jgi:hypothetical protein